MTIKYTTFKSVETLNKAIDAVIVTSQTMQAEVQNVAFGILMHAYKHGDYSAAARLVNGLADGVRKVGLVAYFELAGLVVNEKGDGFSDWKGKDFIKSQADKLKETMWWSLKPANPYKGFDLKAEIARLIKKAENEAKKAEGFKQAGDADSAALVKIDVALLTSLKSMAAPAGVTIQ